MTNNLQIGRINQLVIDRKADPGLYLMSRSGEDVLLPNAYVMPMMKIGDKIDVFLFTDSEDRLVATTRSPEARLGEFARLEVMDVTPIGAFCDWGLPKELFVPLKFQKTPFKVGQRRNIRVSLDERTNRLIGVERFGRFISKQRADFKENQEVKLFVLAKTPLGYKIIIENRFEGMVFSNEIFEPLALGDKRKGFVKKVRIDGKIDISLRPLENADALAKDTIMQALRENNYTLDLTTKSAPEEIYAKLKLSKKAFKRATNELIVDGILEINDGKMRFLKGSMSSKKPLTQ